MSPSSSNSGGGDDENTFHCPADGCGPFGVCVHCHEHSESTTTACQGFRCQCQLGYRGGDCSIAVQECPAPVHPTNDTIMSCWNGGTCVLVEQDEQSSVTEQQQQYKCNCSTAISRRDETAHVGHQCEFAAQESCVVNQAFSPIAFCVNGGKCWRHVRPTEAHPGCDCRTNTLGYEGRHCQYAQGTAPPDELIFAQRQRQQHMNRGNNYSYNDDTLPPAAIFFAIALVIGLCLLFGVIALLHSSCSKSFRNSNAVTSESAKNVLQQETLEENEEEEEMVVVFGVDDDDDDDNDSDNDDNDAATMLGKKDEDGIMTSNAHDPYARDGQRQSSSSQPNVELC